MRWITSITAAVLFFSSAMGQEHVKPGPEHEAMKKREGTWDTVMKAGGAEFKGTMTYRMELGGLWLVGSMESDLMGIKFYGKSLDTYDAGKKKYVSLWCDSMSTQPMHMVGDFDGQKNTLTMIGDGVGMDGKPAKWKSVSELKDNDTIVMSMYVGEGKEPMFVVTYKRKK